MSSDQSTLKEQSLDMNHPLNQETQNAHFPFIYISTKVRIRLFSNCLAMVVMPHVRAPVARVVLRICCRGTRRCFAPVMYPFGCISALPRQQGMGVLAHGRLWNSFQRYKKALLCKRSWQHSPYECLRERCIWPAYSSQDRIHDRHNWHNWPTHLA